MADFSFAPEILSNKGVMASSTKKVMVERMNMNVKGSTWFMAVS
jgi:hypothetical protein